VRINLPKKKSFDKKRESNKYNLYFINISPMSAKSIGTLITSTELKQLHSIADIIIKDVMMARRNIEDIIAGRSNRKILIIGPCSADFESSLVEYAQFLQEIRPKVEDKLEIVMRFYTGKPRSIGGWKGLQSAEP
jgi:3-deoxy-7-phosphoheptulonate synthase